MNDLEILWEELKQELEKEVTPAFMNIYFEPVSIHSYEDGVIVFASSTQFNYKFSSQKYMPILKKALKNLIGFEDEIKLIFTGVPSSQEKLAEDYRMREAREKAGYEIVTSEELERREKEAAEKKEKAELPKDISGILPIDYSFKYTFDNFIVGSSNKFAHAACTAVAARPATAYNPLFIYGPSGLGKTHLMSAIVNEIKRKNPKARVLYIKGDDFTNQMIESLSKQEMHKFHEKYRSCDILLIDDIQFIAGKTSTQEEFFHTFNALFEEGKQIVLSSDRPPKDIQTLEERLKTRFEWGLIADIQPPDLELRIAIIKKKCEQVSVTLPEDVLTFLAENLRSNIRQIEGTVKKLGAIAFLSGREITMEVAASCLQEITGGVVPVQVIVDKIFSAVYNKYGVSKEELLSQKRNKEIAFARHISIYLIRQISEMSFPGIAKIFNRDHATIMASFSQITKKINTDAAFSVEISELKKEISNSL